MPDDLPLIDIPVPHEERVAKLIAAFREQFGRDPVGIAEAPGRVNLIGEHVDYNDGLVLPFAIDRSVLCAWDDGRDPGADLVRIEVSKPNGLHFYSVNQRQYCVLFHWTWEHPRTDGTWIDYPTAVVAAVDTEARLGQGLECVLEGDVPQGSGLSSSAALEVSVAGALRAAFDLQLSDTNLAALSQRAENEYVGVQCGIMDQFASALSKRDHALLIDCRTLDYKHVPLRLAEHGLAIVIANSAVQRELITSAYNDRRRECEEAVVRLRDLLARPNLHSLRDVRSDEIATIDIAPDDTVLRRARHVVSEVDRVAEAVDALDRNDFARLGELMVQSHLSLKTDYEVSSDQLDLLVGLATAQDYVLGARITGAGFGGCTVNLVRANRTEDFARDVIAPYRTRTSLPAVMYITEACDGLRTWRL